MGAELLKWLQKVAERGVGGRASGRALQVLCFVLPDLDRREFRHIKQTGIAYALGISQPQVSRVLKALVRAGVLTEGGRDAHLKTYRLSGFDTPPGGAPAVA